MKCIALAFGCVERRIPSNLVLNLFRSMSELHKKRSRTVGPDRSALLSALTGTLSNIIPEELLRLMIEYVLPTRLLLVLLHRETGLHTGATDLYVFNRVYVGSFEEQDKSALNVEVGNWRFEKMQDLVHVHLKQYLDDLHWSVVKNKYYSSFPSMPSIRPTSYVSWSGSGFVRHGLSYHLHFYTVDRDPQTDEWPSYRLTSQNSSTRWNTHEFTVTLEKEKAPSIPLSSQVHLIRVDRAGIDLVF